MAEYIDKNALDKALTVAAANGKDKDRRTWAKAICLLHDMPAADVAPVVHGRWKYYHKRNKAVCTCCSFERALDENFGAAISCPNCGAKMDGGDGDAAD